MGTPTKTWARLSFHEACNELDLWQEGKIFTCIARPYGSQGCLQSLEHDRLLSAIAELQAHGIPPPVRSVRHIIECLICSQHRETKTKTAQKNVEKRWESDFQPGFFAERRSPSRFPSRTASPVTLSPRTPDRRRARRSPSRSEGAIPQILLTPDETPSVRQQRSYSAPENATTLPAESSIPMGVMPMVMAEESGALDDSPTTNRGRAHQPQGEDRGASEAGMVDSCYHSHPPVQAQRPIQGPSRGRSSRSQRPLLVSLHKDGFHLGAAHTWAPWTIRAKVIELLQEPIPGPNTKAQVYAATVDDVQGRYVKIGYTTRDVNTRLGEISRQHGVSLHTDSACRTVKMPVMQAMRLEALVHADLAFSQRDLRVGCDKRTAVHVEYFELDLEEAWETVEMWLSIMEGTGMQPGKEMDSDAMSEVRRCSAVFETSDPVDKDALARQWAEINGDHGRRRSIWAKLPRRDSAKVDKHAAVVKIASCMLSQALPAVALSVIASAFLPPRWLFAGIVAASWGLMYTFQSLLVG